MTISYGFYDSVGGDRVYNAAQMSSIFNGIIEDGIFGSIGDKLMVSENTGMNVVVGSGRAWFNGTWTYNDADVALTHTAADALLPRIDVVYLEINKDSGTRANSLNILTGTPASTPTAPSLTNTATVFQYPLAHVYVGAAVTSITQANITNKVGLAATPFVTGPLSVISSTDLVAQWEAEFMDWFDAMKDQLSVDAAGSLQLQLDEHDHTSATHGAPIEAGGLADDSVNTTAIQDDAVTADKLAINSVYTAAIQDQAVTMAKIQDHSVNALKLYLGGVGPDALNGAVAGNGLSGGWNGTTGVPLSVNVDNVAIEIYGDQLRLKNYGITPTKIQNRTRYFWLSTADLAPNSYAPYGPASLYFSHPRGDYWLFDPTSIEHVSYKVAIPNDYVAGTYVYVSFLWATSATSGNVYWSISGKPIYDGVDLAVSNTVIGGIASSAPSLTWRIKETSVGSFIPTTGSERNLYSGLIHRDPTNASDTCSQDAALFAVKFSYTADM